MNMDLLLVLAIALIIFPVGHRIFLALFGGVTVGLLMLLIFYFIAPLTVVFSFGTKSIAWNFRLLSSAFFIGIPVGLVLTLFILNKLTFSDLPYAKSLLVAISCAPIGFLLVLSAQQLLHTSYTEHVKRNMADYLDAQRIKYEEVNPSNDQLWRTAWRCTVGDCSDYVFYDGVQKIEPN